MIYAPLKNERPRKSALLSRRQPHSPFTRLAMELATLPLLMAVVATAQDVSPQPAGPSVSLNKLAELFANPGPEYRGKPFWCWNGELQEKELKRQMGVLKEMGMGGFFMHSRTGLKTEYLGEEWFRLINACADEGSRRKMETWLYDEDRWPSGTAGGQVTENPKYRAQYISVRTVPAAEFKWHDDLVAAFAADLEDKTYHSCTRLTRDTPPASFAGKTVLDFTIEAMATNSFFNGYTDADRLSRAATGEFIRLTHEQYKAHCANRLGTSIKGIFTDEPQRGAVFGGFGLDNTNRLRMTPWTDDLPAQFQKRFGYDLVERLPELFFRKDGQEVAPVKWQYMEQLQTMFIENWAKPIHQWCQSNHMIFTGHLLHEDALACQAVPQGSLMRVYEQMDWPGFDVLTEGNRNYWIVKQVVSVARQIGQERVLSELYGCTGWQFNFESHKYVGDWQTLFGMNFRCQHLAWYTMAGEAKRDYPASIFFQSGWWKDYSFVEDYFTRLNLLLAQGNPACDVLVVNPIESLWCQIGVGWASGLSANTPETQALERAYSEVFLWLAGAHIDFDYGDEEMLSRLCKVETDMSGSPVLRVGKAAYRAVVIPKMTTIRSTTLKLLEEFRLAGGKVVVVGEPPAYVDALKSPAAAEFGARAQRIDWNREALAEACKGSLRMPTEIVDAEGKPLDNIFCQLRTDGDRQILVAMNVDRNQKFNSATVRVRSSGQVAEWDCTTGQHWAISSQARNGWVEWRADFPPVGEHAYILSRRPEPGLKGKPSFVEVSKQAQPGPFNYRLSEPNVCVLDLARYQINDGEWQPETEVLKVDRAVRRCFGLPIRSGSMVQPWFSKKHEPAPEVKGRVSLAFDFELEHLPTDKVTLAIEQLQNFRILLNGHALKTTRQGWWVDPALATIALPAKWLAKGTNKLELVTDFRQDGYFEALYLLGNFGVRLNGTRRTLTQLPEKLLPSELAAQRLPFYSGTVTYRIPAPANVGRQQHVFVETPEFEGACVKVAVGRAKPHIIAWKPYQAEITDGLARKGEIELAVVLTRRNTFGPLHQLPLRTFAYGPENWVTEGAAWSQNYQLYPSGLLQPPVISVRMTSSPESSASIAQ